MISSRPQYLFSYGTLQPEHAPGEVADVVRGFEILDRGFVRGTLYDLGSYPGAVFDHTGSRRVWGVVFRLPNDGEVLRKLDAYEGYDQESASTSLFIRRLYPVELSVGGKLLCWVYEYNRSCAQAPIVENGTWAR